jgi:uronate dehydrogenase
MKRVVITGAAGQIGRLLRHGLSEHYTLVLVDRRPQAPPGRGEEVVTMNLTDLAAAEAAMAGGDAVVHLAARADEAPFEELLDDNVVSTYTVFEAARRAGVPRVIFASSNRVTGMYPTSARVGPESPVRPDGAYAVSKVFGEALARLYADEHGLEVACLRLGSVAERPSDVRDLSTWLSPCDCRQLVHRCLETPELDFITVYGVSANTRNWWSDEGWSRLGYRPEDDAESFSSEVGGLAPEVQGL